ncbi:MAG: hypothetical protein ABW167_07740 [Baekduia sp.]
MTNDWWRKFVVLLTGVGIVWCVVLATLCFTVADSVTGGVFELALGVILLVSARMSYVRL